MPAIFLVPIFAFFLSVSHNTNAYVPVTYVDAAGIVHTEKVLQPLIVVTDAEGGTSVRSGFKLAGTYKPALPRITTNDMDILSSGDRILNE